MGDDEWVKERFAGKKKYVVPFPQSLSGFRPQPLRSLQFRYPPKTASSSASSPGKICDTAVCPAKKISSEASSYSLKL